MKPGSKPEVLSLEQAYSLALIRARNPGGPFAVVRENVFDPTALDAEAKRAGTADFDRFQRDFLASGFRAPAARYLTALKYRQAAESARNLAFLTDTMRRLFDELRRGEASGITQMQIDQIDRSLLLARQDVDIALSGYRTAVDELKVDLGLPPAVPIVLDERILEPFMKAFSSVAVWQRHPGRQLNTLSGLTNHLPRPDDVTIGGQSPARVAEGAISEAEFLAACTGAASKQRTVPDHEQVARDARTALELRIRALARGLILTHRSYEAERRELELAVREVDQGFDRLVHPRPEGRVLAQAANTALNTTAVLQAQTRLYRGQSELVTRWLQFKIERLELYRELGVLPYENWDAFYRSFLPETGGAKAAP
jgi:hypothetical protein